MAETVPASVEDLRKIAADLTEKAKIALSPELQKSFEDLAAMYSEMAASVETLDELWAPRQEGSGE